MSSLRCLHRHRPAVLFSILKRVRIAPPKRVGGVWGVSPIPNKAGMIIAGRLDLDLESHSVKRVVDS
jgi:hypothetical protein